MLKQKTARKHWIMLICAVIIWLCLGFAALAFPQVVAIKPALVLLSLSMFDHGSYLFCTMQHDVMAGYLLFMLFAIMVFS